jgi:hypothetical protein
MKTQQLLNGLINGFLTALASPIKIKYYANKNY